MENQLRGLLNQRDRADQEHGTSSAADVAATLAALAGQEGAAREQHEAARQQMDELVATLQAERGRERELAQAAQAARRETQEGGRPHRSAPGVAACRPGAGAGQGRRLAQSRGLEHSRRLAQQLSVDKGWDRAVETVLGGYLEAVCVDSLGSTWPARSESLGTGRHRHVFCRGQVRPLRVTPSERCLRRGPARSDVLFKGIVATDTLHDALRLRPELRAGQSVITRDGIGIGPDWLRVSRDKDAHEGDRKREERLRAERLALDEQAKHRTAESDLEALRSRVRDLEDRLASHQAVVSRSGSSHMSLRSQIDSLRARAEQRSQRMQQLAFEMTEVEGALEAANAGSWAARGRLEEAVNAMGELEERRIALEAEREVLRGRLIEARDA